MITIRRLPSMEHQFELVVTRVYEDEDQELLEDEDETDEERVFLVGQELEFRCGETDGEPTFIWRDLHGDVDEMFEFLAIGTNPPTRAFFETCMYRAMYERKYRKSADATQDADLEEFIYKVPTAGPKTRGKKPAAASSSTTKAKAKAKAPAREPTPPPSPSPPASPVVAEPASQQSTASSTSLGPPQSMPNLEVMFTVEGELYQWKFDREEFDNDGIVHAQVCRKKDDLYSYWIVAATDEGVLLAHQICQDTNPRWSNRMLTMTWNHMAGPTPSSWLFRFNEEKDYTDYMGAFIRGQWETMHHYSWDKIKPEEQNYVLRSATDEDVEMKDIEDDSDEEDEVVAELDPEEEPSDDEEEEEFLSEDEHENRHEPKKGEKNSRLNVGYRGDRSYVVRGNTVGVFDEKVKYVGTIGNLQTPKGAEFRPDSALLHEQDTKLILMNKDNPNSLFNLDLERGKIVEEWQVHDDIAVNNIAPENKFAPTTHEQTLIGTSHNALFRIDPRISGTKLVDSQYKQYVSKNKFSGVVTTAAGKVAVASEKGDIRLFDSIGKNAKTALPPLGDPILGIDVTADGRYLVATTKTYLLLIDTLIGDGKYSGQLGFDRSFPATAKPQPKRLQLKPEHVAYMKDSVSFSPARFNTGEGKQENAIVTSTGEYVVAWDFSKVKKGRLDQYEIKKFEDKVIQDDFRFGDDKEIVVALANNVMPFNKKNLKKPTRESLAPGRQSHSSIVNAPY